MIKIIENSIPFNNNCFSIIWSYDYMVHFSTNNLGLPINRKMF